MQVKITKIVNAEKLKAYATACFDDNFLITGIRVIDSKNGIFVAMPSRRKKSGEFTDVCFPVTREMRERISREVLAAYEEEISKAADKV